MTSLFIIMNNYNESHLMIKYFNFNLTVRYLMLKFDPVLEQRVSIRFTNG